MTSSSLTQARLQELLFYNEHTGEFMWRVHAGNRKKGDFAGSVNHRGYLDISVDGKNYRAHRLVWLYCHGRFPYGVIDHIDGNKLNNKLHNLRDVTNAKNLRSYRRKNSNNTSGFAGVSKNWDGWKAEITFGLKKINLGTYDTKEEAAAAYTAVKIFTEKKEWIGLTDEDRQELAAEQYGWEGLCSAVEAKLREKNT